MTSDVEYRPPLQELAMTWQPQSEPLRQLTGYLRDSLSAHDQAAQKYATMMLTQAKASPDFTNYLTLIFSTQNLPGGIDLKPEDVQVVRSSAAINLKNSVKFSYKSIPSATQAYLRASVLQCLEDPNLQIRNFAGNVITEIVQRGGILGWSELLPELLSLASNERGNIAPDAQEGAMGALVKVCEDNKLILDKDYQGQRPLDVIIPKLLEITTSTIAKVRALALACINTFIPQKPQALLVTVDLVLARLFQLANDPSDDVRRNVCRSFVLLVDVTPDRIVPHMQGLVDYIAVQQRNTDDPELALDAAEFWLCIGEHDKLCATLGPYLGKIVPVLLESIVYSEDDILRLEGGADDANEEDRAEDLKPHFAKFKSARAPRHGHSTSIPLDTNGISTPDFGTMRDDDEELEEGEVQGVDDDDDGEPEERWNVRKCSAAALDIFASAFHQTVFDILLPYLKENLRHKEWPNREAAVLALGAIAEGCLGAILPHLPDIIPYLISMLLDPEPVVRQITCWSLGRYSSWASHLQNPNDKASFFVPMMEGILSRMLDTNKKVQEAAASAFANLEEKATKELTPYCEFIIPQFVRCFAKYKDRNMFILYDCVQTLAEHVGPDLARPDLINTLMPAMIERWGKVSDQSRELFPLLECLSYIAQALCDRFGPYTAPIFTRCVRIIHQNLEESFVANNTKEMDRPDKDFLVTSLDLLSAIIQAVNIEDIEELVATCQPRFFDLLLFCMKDQSNDVRQSAYALLGDCAIHIFPHLQPFLPSLMPVLIQQMDLDNVSDEEASTGFSVINNACWSCGEIAIKQQEAMSPYVEKLYQRLLLVIGNPEIPLSVNENGAIALGRLGVSCSQILAPHLSDFASQFIQIIEEIDDTDEKGHAFFGFNRTVERNPKAMESCLLDYFKAIASYPKGNIREESIYRSFEEVLALYKVMIPDFEAFLSQMAPMDQQRLRSSYNL